MLLNRLHGTRPPPSCKLVTEIKASSVSQKQLTVLQLSVEHESSVFYKWPGRPAELSKLLKWFPKLPLGPKNLSFFPRFLHKKTFCSRPDSVCPHCGDTSGFQHEQFTCPLTTQAHIYLVKQMAAWTGQPDAIFVPLLDRLIAPCSPAQPFMECWNVAYWLLRRAVHSSNVSAHLSHSVLSAPVIILRWRHYLLEFVSAISRSETVADRFSCEERWLKPSRGGSFEVTLDYLPLPLVP
jgi:hypothetical protein